MKLSLSSSSFLLLTAPVLLQLFKKVQAAGVEEKVLVANQGYASYSTTARLSYQCTFRNLWTKERHPVNYPEDEAYWAGPIMWSHTFQFEPWRANAAVTRGVETLAEYGITDILIEEMRQQREEVLHWSEIPEGGFFTSEQDFVHLPPLEVEQYFPYISTLAGMQPSPDWYTGFYSFWVVDEYSRTYYDHLKIQTYTWDAGTDAGTTYLSPDADTDPPLPIERFVVGPFDNSPEGGVLQSPDGTEVPVVAEWECFLVIGDDNMTLPEDCDWFANPCCNETDTINCGATLPYGAQPELSPEYAEVLEYRLTMEYNSTNATLMEMNTTELNTTTTSAVGISEAVSRTP